MSKTHKQRYNNKYGFSVDEDHSLSEISKTTGFKTSGLQEIYNKGIGAWKTNPQSVRSKTDPSKRSVKRSNRMSKEQWAKARVYSAVMKGGAYKYDKDLLVKK